ncbi:hypothetical protein HYV10_00210 [Candidatus Dependentiae bacterium]|nr:hypothetical protein [Candidatus Dependentiae bacterium]
MKKLKLYITLIATISYSIINRCSELSIQTPGTEPTNCFMTTQDAKDHVNSHKKSGFSEKTLRKLKNMSESNPDQSHENQSHENYSQNRLYRLLIKAIEEENLAVCSLILDIPNITALTSIATNTTILDIAIRTENNAIIDCICKKINDEFSPFKDKDNWDLN